VSPESSLTRTFKHIYRVAFDAKDDQFLYAAIFAPVLGESQLISLPNRGISPAINTFRFALAATFVHRFNH
jgi:hypothetical protein